MDRVQDIMKRWTALQHLSDRDREMLRRRFTIDFNYNSNHIEGNTLTYGQTEILLLFGKIIFMYGSDKVFKAMNEWLKYCNAQHNQKEMLSKILNLLVLIRKDLQKNSKLKIDDILLNIMQSENEVKKFKNMN